MPAEHFLFPLLSLELCACLLLDEHSNFCFHEFLVSVLENLKFEKMYRTMVQISLVGKLFLLVFIEAVNE